MEKTIKSMMSLLETNIQSEIKNFIKVELSRIFICKREL
jgi:hypothetical protein